MVDRGGAGAVGEIDRRSHHLEGGCHAGHGDLGPVEHHPVGQAQAGPEEARRLYMADSGKEYSALVVSVSWLRSTALGAATCMRSARS